MKYEIRNIERKHIDKLDKDVLEVDVFDGEKDIAGVSIWQGFPDFEKITFGSSVEGDIVVKPNGKYTTKTLYAPKSSGPMRSAGAITKAMDRKEAGISKFQESKEESIKISSTMRDAVLLTTAQGIEGKTDAEVQEKVSEWRKWLWLQWDKTGTNDINPF